MGSLWFDERNATFLMYELFNLEDLLGRKEYYSISWKNSLSHQLRDLPDFETTFRDVMEYIDAILK